MTETPAAVAGPTTVALESLRRERAQTALKLQHAVPAAALLYAGVQGLARGAHGFELVLAWAEIVFCGLLLRSLAASARRAFASRGSTAAEHPPDRHGSIDWSEVLAGIVLLVEAGERWLGHGHIARPTLLLAAVTIGLGLFHGPIAERARRRRRLTIDADGLEIRGRWTRFSARWHEIARFDVGENAATVATRGGSARRLDFTDLRHADAVRAALSAARERWRAAIEPPTVSP